MKSLPLGVCGILLTRFMPALAGLALLHAAARGGGFPRFTLEEATILDLQAAMTVGTLSSQELVQIYLDRIDAYDEKGPALNAIITINPNAVEVARALVGSSGRARCETA